MILIVTLLGLLFGIVGSDRVCLTAECWLQDAPVAPLETQDGPPKGDRVPDRGGLVR